MSTTLQNPVIVTSTMATSYKAQLLAAGYGAFNTCQIKKIHWVGQSSGSFVIENDDGSVIAAGAYVSPDQTIDFTSSPKRVADFQVTTLSSGTLYIYLA
jgi:hypothetical protein